MKRKFSDSDRLTALAGVFQSAWLVQRLARDGSADREALAASIESLFVTDPDDVSSVFGGLPGIARGLRTLLAQLGPADGRNLEITQYSVALLHLGNKLRGELPRMEKLGMDIRALKRRRQSFELVDSVLHGQLAEIYQSHVSPMTPRIMVRGEPVLLQNPLIQAQIRAALLAGIRAAHLWYQCGGRRWQLLLGRSRMEQIARQLLQQVPDPASS